MFYICTLNTLKQENLTERDLPNSFSTTASLFRYNRCGDILQEEELRDDKVLL